MISEKTNENPRPCCIASSASNLAKHGEGTPCLAVVLTEARIPPICLREQRAMIVLRNAMVYGSHCDVPSPTLGPG